MSTESRPVKEARRARERRRSGMGLAASVLLHVALGVVLVTFVSSSEPTWRGRGAVPISVVRRDGRESGGMAAATATSGSRDPLTPPGDPVSPRRAPRTAQVVKQVGVAATDQAVAPAADQAPADGVGEAAGAGDVPGTGGAAPAQTAAGGGTWAQDSESGAGGTGTGGAAGGSTAADDTAERQYALDVRRRLERRGAYPGTARRLGLEGVARILIRIDEAGAVVDRRLLESSGYPQLDEAALASADRLGALPPPPGGRPVNITVPVRFSMRRN